MALNELMCCPQHVRIVVRNGRAPGREVSDYAELEAGGARGAPAAPVTATASVAIRLNLWQVRSILWRRISHSMAFFRRPTSTAEPT